MNLLVPLGLIGLISLPIIAILHMVRQRRQRLRIPTIRLWAALKPPPERQQRKLPLTLLLALHLLVAACLALGLTQPSWIFGVNDPRHVVIILDTTSSMMANGTFAQAQQQTQALLADLGRDDSVALVELNHEARLLGYGGYAERQQLRQIVAELAPAGNNANLAQALSIANATLANDRQNQMLVLSDGVLPTSSSALSVAAELEWRTLGESTANSGIVTFASRRLPNQRNALYARVTNFSDLPAARTLTLLLDGELEAEQNIVIQPGGSEERTWEVGAGELAELQLSPNDDYAIDDRALVSLDRSGSLRVHLATLTPSPLERMLRSLPNIELSVGTGVSNQRVDLTVLNGVLPEQLPSSALLIVNPPRDERLLTEDSILGEQASSAVLDADFAGIDLSSVQWGGRRPMTRENIPTGLTSVIETDTQLPLVLRGTWQEQVTIVWLFNLDNANLSAKLAFPLLTAASIANLTGGSLPEQLAAGSFAPNTPLTRPDGQTQALDQRLNQAGLYRVVGSNRGGIAVNFGDPQESNLQQQSQPTISQIAQPEGDRLAPQGTPLWPILIGLALALLVVEWWYSFRS
ncbi:VWA domain-containing protein [Herpetosiphon llansteffanensis]